MRPHRAPLILVFGILGFALCPFFGLAAWIMGTRDLNEMQLGQMDPAGHDLTKAGRILGMVATAMIVVEVGILVTFFAVGFSAAH